MRVALALALVGLSLTCAWGVARALLPARGRYPLLLALTTLGLSAGFSTLLLAWLMWARPGRSPFALASLGGLLLLCATVVRAHRGAGGHHNLASARRWLGDPFGMTLGAVIAAVAAGIVLNAVWWPFDAGDALAVYAPLSRHFYERWTLPTGVRLYEAYPQLLPLAFALAHWAWGGLSEYLARFVAALMALGAIGAAGALGRDMRSPRAGLAAAALVAVTPVFGRWASSGYADVPGGFFLGLSAAFAWLWRRDGEAGAALLAGLAAGLAMWTKNSTLVVALSLPLVAAARWKACRGARGTGPSAFAWSHVALMLGAAAGVAGPWYLRNALVFGFVVPPTVWSDRARHELGTLALLLRGDQHFGVPGWLFTAAFAYAFWRALARDSARASAWQVLLAYAVPFAGAWWWLASYETRFLMTVLPILAVMAALMLAEIADRFLPLLPRTWARRAPVAAAAFAVLLLPASMRKTIEHKAVLFGQPWLDDAGRHRVRLGGLYDVAMFLNRLPAGSRVSGVPPMIRYHLELSRLGDVEWTSTDALPVDRPAHYDYVVRGPDDVRGQSWVQGLPVVLRTVDGYVVHARRGAPRASLRQVKETGAP